MKSPIQLANYSEEVYEYSMLKKFEKRMAAHRKRRFQKLCWAGLGAVLAIATMLAGSVLLEAQVMNFILGL